MLRPVFSEIMPSSGSTDERCARSIDAIGARAPSSDSRKCAHISLVLWPPGAAEDPRGRLRLGPQWDLVEPVHAPIAELAVAEVEELAPAAGMDLAAEGPQRRRTAIEVPVHPRGRGRVGGGLLGAAAVVG